MSDDADVVAIIIQLHTAAADPNVDSHTAEWLERVANDLESGRPVTGEELLRAHTVARLVFLFKFDMLPREND